MKARVIDTYWSKKFGLKENALYEPDVLVLPHVQPWEDTFAYIFVRGSTCFLSVGPTLVEVIQRRIGNQDTDYYLNEITSRRTSMDGSNG
jgi:hypothetical protein